MQVALSTKISAEAYIWVENRSKHTGIPKTQIFDAAIKHYQKYIESEQRPPAQRIAQKEEY